MVKQRQEETFVCKDCNNTFRKKSYTEECFILKLCPQCQGERALNNQPKQVEALKLVFTPFNKAEELSINQVFQYVDILESTVSELLKLLPAVENHTITVNDLHKVIRDSFNLRVTYRKISTRME